MLKMYQQKYKWLQLYVNMDAHNFVSVMWTKWWTMRMGFEPTRAEHNGLAVHRLNHSATSSEFTLIELPLILQSFFCKYLIIIIIINDL